MATLRELAERQVLSFDQAWELVLDIDMPEGSELIALSEWCKTQHLDKGVKKQLFDRVSSLIWR